MTLLTVFSAPKPFTNPHIALIQRNALQSWLNLGDGVEVLLVGDEDAHQGAGPAVLGGDQKPHGFQHGDHRALGIAGAAAVKQAALLAQGKGIAGPAFAGGHHVDMGVEGECGARAVFENARHIAAARHDLDRVGAAAHALKFCQNARGCLELAARRVLRVEADQLGQQRFQRRFFKRQRHKNLP